MFSADSQRTAWVPSLFVPPRLSQRNSIQPKQADEYPVTLPESLSKHLSAILAPQPFLPKQRTLCAGDTLLPPIEQHPAFRTSRPKHVPIVITHDIIESVLRELPDSPDSANGEYYLPISSSILLKGLQGQNSLGTQASQKPRHIPIIIPDFAQPYGPFPPTPSDSECSTPRPLRGSPIGPPTPPMTTSRPTTSGSRTSTLDSSISAPSPSQMYTGRFQSSSSSYPADMNSSKSSLNNDPAHELASPQQPQDSFQSLVAAHISTAVASATSQQAQTIQGTTNLSGLVCNVHKCTGKEPHALVGATTTILGDKLYVFGGRRLSRRRAQLTADLYHLDLVRRHWTKLETYGSIPPPRYFHSVCALGDNKLVCYGGMSPASVLSSQPHGTTPQTTSADQQPEVVVMSDIHVYDVNTRTWTFIPTTETPQGRYAHCATILPSSAIFTSTNAPYSAIHHNPSSENPNQGSLGVALDGTGGAEMVVVGGQDSANHYIEQISVFNLRSLKWTGTHSLGRSCGAYRSVVAPFTGLPVSRIGHGSEPDDNSETSRRSRDASDQGSSMLIYSNYNFLDVKLELQVRLPNGSLTEKHMQGQFSPPGLRFPNGGVLDRHFVVSGTYLTSSKQEYALWALDLRTLTWSRIDTGGSVFSQGSWNRGVLWPRRNTFVILGNRKRNLVDDYNHRRINFSNICLVELEAFGLYDNPRHANPTSAYLSFSSPKVPSSLRLESSVWSAGGRPHFPGAEELGQMAMGLRELADMDILSISGERIPVNSHILARRWGPYFVHLLREVGKSTSDDSNLGDGLPSDAATLRAPNQAASRNSSITITPSISTTHSGSTLATPQSSTAASSAHSRNPQNIDSSEDTHPFHPPTSTSFLPLSRPRTLFLPHTPLTLHALLHYLYTSSLPPPSHSLSTPQILCSLLQIARPYHVDGLLEAVVERLHQVMDGRNAAAVFNASAMAAGGGRGTGFDRFRGVNLNNGYDVEINGNHEILANGSDSDDFIAPRARGPLRIDTSFRIGAPRQAAVDESEDEDSSVDGSASKASSVTDGSEYLGTDGTGGSDGDEVWDPEGSCVVGLQKRGLRGLMEGRRIRERGRSVGVTGAAVPGLGGGEGDGRIGLGIV